MKEKKNKKIISMILVIIMVASAFIPTQTYQITPKAVTKTQTKIVPIGANNRTMIAKSKKGTIYTYRSSNEKVAKVSPNGVVTGKKKGKASIIRYVTKKGKTKIDKVLVYKVRKFTITGEKTVYMNGTYKFNTNGINATFQSKNKKIATITKKGKLVPKKNGKVTIVAKYGKLKAKKVITVKKDSLEKITATYNGATIYQGQNINAKDLTVVAIYKSGKKKTITDYKVSQQSFEKAGNQTVTVSYQNCTADCQLVVSERKVNSIQAVYRGGSLAVGQTVEPQHLQVTVVYNDGTTQIAAEKELALTNATAKEKGTLAVTVTHTPSGVQTTVNVLVNALTIMGVDTQYSDKVFYTEDGVDTNKIKILVTYEDGSTKLVDASDIRIGSVTTEDGNAKIVLYYTVDGVEYSTVLSVEERSRKLCGLVVESVSDCIYLGKELNPANYVVKAIYSDGTEKVVTEWTSDYLPATEEGKQTVHFQYTEDQITVSSEKEFEIKQANPVGIKVASAPATVKEGMPIDTSKMEVRLQYEDGQSEILSNYQLDYNQEDTSVGNRNVVVSYQNFSAQFEIQVVAKRVVALEVTSPTKETIAGQDINLTGMTVTAKFDNQTSSVVDGWTTNYSTGLSAGEHTLIVSYEGIEATFRIRISDALVVQQSASSEIVKHPVTIASNHADVTYSLASGSATLNTNSGNSCVVTPMTPGNVVINVARENTSEIQQVTISAAAYKMSYSNANGGNAAVGDTLVFTANAPTQFTYRMETDSGTVNTGNATPGNATYQHTVKNTGKLTVTAKDLVSGETFSVTGDATVKVGKTITLKTTKQVVTWSSSNTAVATVSSSGVVKGIKKGTVTITATFPEYGNRTASKVITVKKK